MKTIRKNLLLLAFAAGALFVIGNNVLAEGPGSTTELIMYNDSSGGSNIKQCMRDGGFMLGFARDCRVPSRPTLPARKCGSRQFISGRRWEQCW